MGYVCALKAHLGIDDGDITILKLKGQQLLLNELLGSCRVVLHLPMP
jgi:hypothetical protein